MNLRFEKQLILILLGYLFLATAYSVVNPIHEGTDELRHYRFVRTLVENRRLPVQGEELCRSQSHHPPLFYAAGALLTGWIDTGQAVCTNPVSNPFWAFRYWDVGTDNKNMYIHTPAEAFPWRGATLAAHLVRLLNVLIGGAAVAVTYWTARLIWPKRRYLAIGGVAALAFNPMFLYMAGTINNDVIAALAGALVALAGVMLLRRETGLNQPAKIGAWLGVVYAFALMSKFSLAPMAAPLAVVVAWIAWRTRQIRTGLTALVTMGGVTFLLAGWWFVRNWWLYGDPTGFNPVTELWGVRTPSESWGLVWLELPNVWSSFWGRFGFGQIPLPEIVYSTLWVATLAAAAGGVVWTIQHAFRRQHRQYDPDVGTALPLVYLLVVVLLSIAVVISYMLVSPAGAMGRFLFPGLPAFSLLFFWGITRWLVLAAPESSRPFGWLAWGQTASLAGLAIIALWGYLAPAYAHPPTWTADDIPAAAITPEAPVVFEPFIRLHAYQIEDGLILPGEPITITLYWEVLSAPPGDYYFFAHLIDNLDLMVTQRDTHPATGKFPAGQWRAGDRFVDRLTLYPPDTAFPDTARLQIGFYAPKEKYRLGVTAGGISQGDAYTLGVIDFFSDRTFVEVKRNFANQAALLGYRYASRKLTPGETAEVTLYWAPDPAVDWQELELRLYLGDTSGPPLATKILSDLAQKTTLEGEPVWETTFSAPVPAALEGEQEHFTIILFDIFTQKRLNMIAERGNWIDNELSLGGVRISSAAKNE